MIEYATRGCAPCLRTHLDASPRFTVSGKQEEQQKEEQENVKVTALLLCTGCPKVKVTIDFSICFSTQCNG